MSSRAETEYRYEKLTWPEINDAIDLGKVCIVPCGAVEQHGPHLPLDVDLVCPTGIARGAGALVTDKMLVLPTVCYGYTGHVMDFPGTINNDYQHFIEEGMPVQLASADPATTRTWLHEFVGLDIRLPDDPNGTCTLIGARHCTLAGEPTAFAVYEIDGAPVALAVVSREVLTGRAG